MTWKLRAGLLITLWKCLLRLQDLDTIDRHTNIKRKKKAKNVKI